MTCREFVDFLLDYLERTLPTEQRDVFEEHIGEGPTCVTYVETYKETIRLGQLCRDSDGPVPEEVPEGLVRAILAARER